MNSHIPVQALRLDRLSGHNKAPWQRYVKLNFGQYVHINNKRIIFSSGSQRIFALFRPNGGDGTSEGRKGEAEKIWGTREGEIRKA